MELTRAWRRALAAMKTAVALATAVACITTIATPAFAGTTGVVKGTVTENGTIPVADVSVTLRSPSGSYHTVTDSKGFYAIAGVYADTYTASFEKSGYNGQVVSGVSVFADQSVTVNAELNKSLKTIANVTARSTASAFQPEQTTDTYTVNTQQIQNLQGSDFNISESNLLTSLPGVGYDSSGYPVIHGGRENEEGFEFEGIPYTDAFTNQFVNTLALPGSGVASAQLTPGVGDASVQSNGTGVINLVAQRGTYPGYAMPEFSVGGPGFYHAFNGSISYASANGHISDYAAFAGAQTAAQYGPTGTPANLIGDSTSTLLEADREFLNNLVFRFGKNDNQAVQFFADIAQHNFFQGYGGLAGWCFESCNPFLQNLYGPIYGFSNQQIAGLTGLYPFQTSLNETLAQAQRTPETYYQPNQSYKVQYNLNINPSTYLMADMYSVNSVVNFDFVNGGANCCGYGDLALLQGGHSLGGKIALEKQLNSKNLIELGVDYAWLHPEYQEVSPGYGWLAYLISANAGAPYDFINPTDTCPIGAGNCGSAYAAFANPPSQLTLPPFVELSNINRRDVSYYINDKVTLGDRFNASVGLRAETASYVGLPTPGLQSNCTFLYNPSSVTANTAYNPANPTTAGNCPYLPTFNVGTNETKPSELEPRLGISWQLGRNTAVRATYDRSTTFPILAIVDNIVATSPTGMVYAPYNKVPADAGAACGIAPYNVPCTSLGQELFWTMTNFEGVPYQTFKPMTENDYQITLEHQFTKGWLRGVALSVAPWTLHQYDAEASVSQPVLQANGQPLIENNTVVNGPSHATNLGTEYASGVDFNVTKENPVGLSGQFTASYINEFSSVIPTSVSEDFFPSIPYASALAGDVYRVGFISPFQATLGLTYKTLSGWRINPRLTYNIGYPVGQGTLTALLLNNKAYNVPNTNVLPGSAASSAGVGSTYFVDPMNPGSVFAPNIAASSGFAQGTSAGSKLSPQNYLAAITIEYSPPKANYKIGLDIENIFNRLYYQAGAGFNSRFQPIATGIGGPLTGYTSNPTDYSVPYANTQYLPAYGGNGVFTNFPSQQGRNYYVYYSVKI